MQTNKILLILSITALFSFSCSNDKKVEHELFNTTASPIKSSGSLDATAILNWHMVTLLKDTKSNTFKVLYANEQAYKSVQQGNGHYQTGAVLSLITWQEKPDIHWFGATIPGEITLIEQVIFEPARYQKTSLHYTSYIKKENGFEKLFNQEDSSIAIKNTNFILALRRPYLPD